ncbi:hypothetical protein G9A89_003973 [Geosiphon pyriformis]|nr:hypothetical protein G9A89_003973 [Geosiphon pyriformis]
MIYFSLVIDSHAANCREKEKMAKQTSDLSAMIVALVTMAFNSLYGCWMPQSSFGAIHDLPFLATIGTFIRGASFV